MRTRPFLNLLLFLSAMIGVASMASAQSASLPTDRARVTVRSIVDPLGGPRLKVLRTDATTPIRAGTAWIWSKQWEEEPAEYYAALRGRGLNAVRIVLFDTWEHEAGYGGSDWNDPAYRTAAIGRIERAVNYCSVNGLYAIINSHNKIPEYAVAYNDALWTHVAPYFRSRTHVLYEASNEALSGTGIKADGLYGDSLIRLQELRTSHDLIRRLAPDTHVMVLTPAGVSGWGFVDGLARLTRRFEQLPGTAIDWAKTSVAYHLYHADENLFPNAEILRAFHAKYPGWPSENNFPKTLTNEQLGITDSWRGVSFGTEEFTTQTCERLGLGWSHWNINRFEQFNRNFPFLWKDAVDKGYAWKPDPVVNKLAVINAGGPTVGRFNYDINYFGGDIATNNPTGPVDIAGVANAAPADVYRSERYGNFTYEVARLAPTKKYRVRLHFCESWSGITAAGQRTFNVSANGRALLTNFDIFAASGKKRNRAHVRNFVLNPDSRGRLLLKFDSVVQSAKVDGIEILPEN
jgi:hypothetical protein